MIHYGLKMYDSIFYNLYEIIKMDNSTASFKEIPNWTNIKSFWDMQF